MKKIMILALALLMLLSLTACGSKNTEEPAAGGESVGLPNPWTEAASAEEAAKGAGVGEFVLPENATETTGGRVDWMSFRYMKDLAQADGGIGSAELTARKGVKHSEAEDVSGDYTSYKYGWSQEVDGTTVNCYGNEEGHMMKALWESGDFAYSLVVRGQGDIHDTYGIDALAVEALVRAIG